MNIQILQKNWLNNQRLWLVNACHGRAGRHGYPAHRGNDACHVHDVQ